MKRLAASALALCILFCCTAGLQVSALASVFEHSDTYRASEYYNRLVSVSLTGNYGDDIASIALSQVGYHEGKSLGDISGASSGKGNYTEYGVNFGLPDDAWCMVFVWWCARQAGVNESIVRKTEWAKASLQPFNSLPLSQCRNISAGDIAFIDMSHGDGIEDHAGIVVGVSENEIITVEGNSSNGVRKQTYSRSTGKRSDGAGTLLFIGSPDYYGSNTPYCTYETVFVSSPGAETRETLGGKKTGSLSEGEYMLLTSDPSGAWLQIAAPNGIDSLFIPASGASLTVKNLPPITGFDAWSTFEPAVSQSTTQPSVIAPQQTDPTVTTSSTAVTTVTTTVSTTASTVPTMENVGEHTDNGYTSSFGSDWVRYAAYALLGVLAIAFVVILASLMGRKGSDDEDNYYNYR